MDDFTQRAGEEESRPREVEGMFAFATDPAQPFDGGRGFAALRAEGRLDRRKLRPAVRTAWPVPVLQYGQAACDARHGKQQIENRIDQSRRGNAKGQSI
jgi:hypothetical protein